MRRTGIPVTNSRFHSGSGVDRTEGTFYGPKSEEVGGIFERDRIIGAYGAKRRMATSPLPRRSRCWGSE